MKRHYTYSKITTIIIFVLMCVVALFILLTKNAHAPVSDTEVPHDVATSLASQCGLTITNPTPSATVGFPLLIEAVVDNTQKDELGCSWSTFEANAGPVELLDENNIVIATSFLSTSEEWMTLGPVDYSTTLIPSQSIPSGTNLTLLFTEDDPSDGEAGPVDTFSLPLIAQ